MAALAVVDLKIMLEVAERAVGGGGHAATSRGLDGILEHALMASTSAAAARSACRCGRRWWRRVAWATAAPGQRLADVDVAEAATTRWSLSAALSEVFLPAQAFASMAASNSLPKGSARARATAALLELDRGTSFIEPKRRGSLKVMTAPFDM